MAMKTIKVIKIQAPAGKANPAPPIGPALGGAGVNIMEFVQQFNERTKDKNGIIPALISVYEDRSFKFITMEPPVAELIKEAAKVEKGSGVPNKQKVGSITSEQVEVIASRKMPDLNAKSLETASAIVRGTARSMGVEVK